MCFTIFLAPRCSREKLEEKCSLEMTSQSPSPVPSFPESISEEELGDEIVIKEQPHMDMPKEENPGEENQAGKEGGVAEVIYGLNYEDKNHILVTRGIIKYEY